MPDCCLLRLSLGFMVSRILGQTWKSGFGGQNLASWICHWSEIKFLDMNIHIPGSNRSNNVEKSGQKMLLPFSSILEKEVDIAGYLDIMAIWRMAVWGGLIFMAGLGPFGGLAPTSSQTQFRVGVLLWLREWMWPPGGPWAHRWTWT